ncbi:2OG-Fe(II) oxygenase [Pseudomonas sp. NPDC007930]|uniref:2OG-Fe(II) oxygenase n=1 Tax=Pseudomonas sp. NPDC007930 TaxID=3364417 RepID=UPI0036F047FB
MIFSEHDIQVIDNAIAVGEQTQILKNLKSSLWRYGWPRDTSFFTKPCWHSFIAGSGRASRACCELELSNDPAWGFLAPWWRHIKHAHIPRATLLGVYANGQTFGQDSPIHRDNWPGEQGSTVLIFCNEHWASAWGGELVFYDQARQHIIRSILPKPGRAVIFNGHIPHSARSPASVCDELRMTIAFKTIIAD